MPAPDRTAAENRVRAYVADHFAWWRQWGRLEPGNFSDPLEPLTRTVQDAGGRPHAENPRIDAYRVLERHWAANAMPTDRANDRSSSPDHHPEHESPVTVSVSGDQAEVETLLQAPGIYPRRYGYFLARQGAEWKITKLWMYFYDPDGLPEAAGCLDGVVLPTRLPFVGRTDLDLEQAFRPQQLLLGERLASIQGERVGELCVRSGILIAHDCGDFINAVPFAAQVLPGNYPVVLSLDERGTVGMAKLVIRPREATVAFVPAKLLDGAVDLSVDGGCLGFADARTVLAQSARTLEKLEKRLFEATYAHHPPLEAAFASVEGNQITDAVTIQSGHGDGGYPCYWGLNERGEPVSLVADFLVYGTNRALERVLPFTPGLLGSPLDDPVLTEHGFAVQLSREGTTVVVNEKGGCILRAVLSDLEGGLVADTDRSPCESGGGRGRTTFLQNVPEDFSRGQLLFRWRVWEHAFARRPA